MLALAQKQGELASVQVLAEAVDGERVVVRERLLAIPGKLQGQLQPEEVHLVENELYEALEQLSAGADLITSIVGEGLFDEGTDDVEAAAAPEPDRMGRHLPARG